MEEEKKEKKEENLDSRLAQIGKNLTTICSFIIKKEKARDLFLRAGFKDIPYERIAQGFIATWVITIIWYIYLLFGGLLSTFTFIFIILTFIFFILGFEIILLVVSLITLKIYLNAKIYNRIQNMEENLPLFLRELSTNLKAGREFVDALEDSLTPQLGELNEDIKQIIVQIRSGMMIDKVLYEYSQRYDSFAMNETFEIILEAHKGGGGLSEIIDKIAENLEMIHYLRKNAIASVANYIIFTTIVALLLAPILFALSYNLLLLIDTLMKKLVVTGNSPSYFNFVTQFDINFDDFVTFSRIGIAVISGSAASIIALIRKGSLRGAPVLVLIYIFISLVMFEVWFKILSYMFTVLYHI